MVSSPFRRTTKSSNNNVKNMPGAIHFSDGPEPKQSCVWIGGDVVIGEGTVVEAFRNLFSSPASRKQKTRSGEKTAALRELVSSSANQKRLTNRQTKSKSPIRIVGDGKRLRVIGEDSKALRSILKSLSPEKDTDGDVFFSPFHGSPTIEAPSKIPSSKDSSSDNARPRSVQIGGETIIDDDGANNTKRPPMFPSAINNDGKTNHRSSITSIRIPKRSTTFSSLGSDLYSDNFVGEKDLEAANSPLHQEEANLPRRDSVDLISSPLFGVASTGAEVDHSCSCLAWDGNNNTSKYTQLERQIITAPNGTSDRVGRKRKSIEAGTPSALRTPLSQRSSRKISIAEGSILHNHQLHSADGVKRRRLSKRARTRLTMREVNSHIQPGRSYSTLESMCHFEKRKTITIPKVIDFFRRVEVKLILVNVSVSVVLTTFALYTCPTAWQTGLQGMGVGVSILGAFLSFALVFRTQTCYNRWWEARTQWGRMTSAVINVAGQARNWFGDEDLVDKFLTHCIVFPYSCKAVLRGNQLSDANEEGPRFLHSGMLTDADLGVIIRHGRPPFVCLEIMRHTMYEAFNQHNDCEVPTEMLNGILLSMEQSLWELNLNFGSCLKINSTRMPASYTVFMRSFVIFFFVLASLAWAPTIKWLTPILTGFMVFLINTVIVIGDQMMHPFDLQWAGLALQKFCVVMEHEIMNVSRRHADIMCLFHY